MCRKTYCRTTTIFLAAVLCLITDKLLNTQLHWPILFTERAAQAANDHSYHPTTEFLCQYYTLICVGKVVKADLGRKAWCGGFLITSNVEYKVLKVLKGNYDKPMLIVGHLILCPTKRVTKRASLSKQFFKPGREFLLCLQYDKNSNKYVDDASDECVQPYTTQLEQRIVETLRIQKKLGVPQLQPSFTIYPPVDGAVFLKP